MGQAKQLWSGPVPPAPEVGEGAIVEASAHAQAVSLLVEADQRQEYQVQSPGSGLQAAVGLRFADAETVACPALATDQPLETHAIGRPFAEYRQVAVLAHPAGLFHQCGGVYLAIIGQIEGDVPAAAEQGVLGKLL